LRLHLISPYLSPCVRQPKKMVGKMNPCQARKAAEWFGPTLLYDFDVCRPEVSTGKGCGIWWWMGSLYGCVHTKLRRWFGLADNRGVSKAHSEGSELFVEPTIRNRVLRPTGSVKYPGC
jgi:hypothetical protein